jgi:hypothetical protein
MNSQNAAPPLEDLLAKILPPPGYEGCVVAEVHGHLVWMKREDLKPSYSVCFFDGDCRTVLTPDDPKVRNYLR